MLKQFSYFFVGILTIWVSLINAEAVTIHQPGYTIILFASAPGLGDDLDVDIYGNIYAPTSSIGVTQFDPDGSPTLWSHARGNSLALTSTGIGYLATRGLDRSILRINPDGSFSVLVPPGTYEWTWLAVDDSDNLYANIWAGPGQGIYQIDINSGIYRQVIAGGPGWSGMGYYWDMTFGPDGRLYVSGNDGTTNALFRLDIDHFTQIAQLPHAGIGLTVDPDGIFYTATSFGGSFYEVWIVDPKVGKASLLASDLNAPSGIAYDAVTERLFVRDQNAPYRIWAIAKDSSTNRRP